MHLPMLQLLLLQLDKPLSGMEPLGLTTLFLLVLLVRQDPLEQQAQLQDQQEHRELLDLLDQREQQAPLLVRLVLKELLDQLVPWVILDQRGLREPLEQQALLLVRLDPQVPPLQSLVLQVRLVQRVP